MNHISDIVDLKSRKIKELEAEVISRGENFNKLRNENSELKEALLCIYYNSRANYITRHEKERFKVFEKLINEIENETKTLKGE